MARALDAMIEFDVVDDVACNAHKGCLESTLVKVLNAYLETSKIIPSKSLPRAISDFSPARASTKELELSEPECELDPLFADLCLSESGTQACEDNLSQMSEPVQSKKLRKKRHASLIDKALKDQEKQQHQSDDFVSNSLQKDTPLYIGHSDLISDWSRYTAKPVMGSLPEPILVSSSMKVVDVNEAQINIMPKRNRKKSSMIDKAASRQRTEEGGAQYQPPEVQQMKAAQAIVEDATSTKRRAFCSLCDSGKKKSFCVLCGSR
jgi:hypothetical protein